MASHQKWLNIVVDGNQDLAPYWPKIVSDYLQKIVRCFCDNSGEQGAKDCRLGLVMYNANSELGFDVQYIDWTKDVDCFLGSLSGLAFNGDQLNQYAMAEGLAEALMMYRRGSSSNGTMSTQDYYYGERHCILVAAGDPVPRKMQVTVPRVREGKFVGDSFDTFYADFLDVAQIFSPLAISLSVITPKQNAIFGEIFNVGNNVTEMGCAPLSNYKVGQFVVLLSRNFKEAREALHGKRVVIEDPSRKRSLESMRTTDITLAELFAGGLQEDLFSVGKTTTIGEQSIENLYGKRSVESTNSTSDLTFIELFTDDFQEGLFSTGKTTIIGEQSTENSYGKRSVESTRTNDLTLTEIFTNNFQEDLFSAAKATMIGEQTIEAAKAVRPKELRSVANTEPQLFEVIPNAITDKKHVSVSSSNSLPTVNDQFEDLIAELNTDDIDLVLPSKKPKTSFTLVEDPLTGLFLPAPPSFDNDVQDSYRQEKTNSTKKTISMDALKAVEAELEQAILLEGDSSSQNTSRNQACIIDLTNDIDKEVQISSGLYPIVPFTPSTGIGSSKGPLLEQRGNVGVVNHFSLGNTSSSSAFTTPHQNSSSLWPEKAPQPWYERVRSGFCDPIMEPVNQARNVFGNSLFPNATSNSVTQFQVQPSTSPFLSSGKHFGGGSRGNFASSGLLREQHFPGYLRDPMITTTYGSMHMPAFGRSTAWAPPVPRMMPQAIHPGSIFPPRPSIMDFHDPNRVHTWEGYLGGKLPTGRMSYNRAKGFRRASSHFTLTFQWSGRLEMNDCNMPMQAVIQTQSLMRHCIDYVFFHIIQYNNLDLYDCLVRKNECARVDLPTQTLILCPTESQLFYVGIVFPLFLINPCIMTNQYMTGYSVRRTSNQRSCKSILGAETAAESKAFDKTITHRSWQKEKKEGCMQLKVKS